MSQALIRDSVACGSQELAAAACAVGQIPPQTKNIAEDQSKPAGGSIPARGAAVIVVGAGPAGLLAAHFLARRHGCKVDVFDRRQHPGPIPMRPGDDDDDDRAFAVAMNCRGAAAAEAAGLDVSAFTTIPGTHICEVRHIVMARGDGLPGERSRGSALTMPFGQPRVVGSRQAFVRALLHQVEQQQAAAAAGSKGDAPHEDGHGQGSIAFHWGASFTSADLAAREATFQLADGSSATHKYALLVGADGYWSRVRRAAELQVAELQVTTTPADRQYKVVRGLQPLPYLPFLPLPNSAGSKAPRYGRLYMVQEAAAGVKAAGGGAPGSLFLSQPFEEGGVTAVLSMVHARWQGLEGGSAEAYRALLQASYPSLPESWAQEMAAQLAGRPLCETGMQVHASQLHGPGLVLLGDAAHAVSPATSNGMNSALEDAAVLSQVLERCGGDLAALPHSYTAARLEDVRGLLWLDSAMSALAGRGGASAALKASVVARLLLHKATAGWVRNHGFVLLKDGSLPYAQAAEQVRRDQAAARVVTTGAALALLGAAAAGLMAAGLARLRGANH